MGKTTVMLVLGFTVIMGNMLLNINKSHFGLSTEISKHYKSIISRNIANSAANMAISELYRDFNWNVGIDTTTFDGGTFKVEVRKIDFDTSLTLKRVKIMAVSHFNGVTDTVVTVLAQPPFSYYASFNSQWPTNLYYGTGDSLWGPVHSNQKFGFAGYPVFYGKVTSVASDYRTWGPTEPVFLGGSEFGVDPIDLPSSVPALEDSANAGGLVFTYETWLRFNANGTFDYGYDNTFSTGTSYLTDYNGTMKTIDGYDIHVQGVVKGQVSIYSGRDILIEDDIIYSQDPRDFPQSEDILGLIAKRDVIVTDSPGNSNNVKIHAAIMALNLSFKVENYNTGGPRGTLTTLGSVVQVKTAPYATAAIVNGQVAITNGYREKSIYDERFLHFGPPVFPIVPRVMVYSWQEHARHEDFLSNDIIAVDNSAIGVVTEGVGELLVIP